MKYQTNGKMEDEISKIKGLEELLGLKKVKVFKSISSENIDDKLSSMTLLDLQKFAVEIGISGGGDRSVLKKKIKTEFLKYIKGSNGTALSFQN